MTLTIMPEIQALSDGVAGYILSTIIQHRVEETQAVDEGVLVAELATEVQATPAASATPGEVARLALQLLVEEPETHDIVLTMARNPRPEQFAIGEAVVLTAVITAAIKILSSHVRYEVDKNGKRTLLIDTKSSSEGLIKAIVEKLLALKFFRGS
ncbi:MAG: hypothetical protein ACYDCO_08305 [Armatimonadota bacterium]